MIEFQHVHKTYRVAGRDIPALHPTSLRVEDGQVFGLIGHSGAGKSTLADVLMGLLRPDKGQLRVDGTVLSDQRRIAWRNSVSYVPQEVTLYSGTIRENLLRGNSDASDADIDAALPRRLPLIDRWPAFIGIQTQQLIE